MTTEALLSHFADSLQSAFAAIGTANSQPEDQLKSPIVTLIGGLGEITDRKLVATTESVMAELEGRPDVAVVADSLLTGHIELKAPGKGANTAKLKGVDAKQWKKFANHPNIVYTDGREWALYRNGSRVGELVRLSGDPSQDGAGAIDGAAAHQMEILFRNFLSWEPIVPTSPKRLAETLAPLCRLLRDDAFSALQVEGSAMRLLADEWRDYLFADADDQQFADAYAQTVTYALLLARVEGAEHLTATAADQLDSRHGLLAQVLRILAQKESRAEVEVPIGLLERTIDAIDPTMMTTGKADPWLYFYEDFLAAYDPKLRNNRGVYYTPAQVVQAQVALVTELLHQRFGKSLGIIDDGVVLLDPAAGTGTYILAAIDSGLAEASARFGPGEAPGRASAAALNFHGFELLVGPYAVAHLRVAQRILERGGTLPDDGVRIYLADTLESPFVPGHGKQTSLTHRRLAEESERARRVKAEERVLVCIGNPPYDRQEIDPADESTERKGGWVRFGGDGEEPILGAFTEPVREAGEGGQLKNLYNDYVYFWRWALWKVFDQSAAGGIVSFISASSYLRGPAFAGMRKAMRETFDELWIIDLGGDNLGARKSENVFAIRTPVAIAIGVRAAEPNPDAPADVRYCGSLVHGSRAEKLQSLAELESLADLDWETCLAGWGDPLLPERQGNYSTWPKLTELFPWQHSGAQFKRTWPIAPAPDVLKKRWEGLVSTDAKERPKAFRETRDRKIASTYADLFGSGGGERPDSIASLEPGAQQPKLEPYGFRSLDRQYVLADSRVGDFPRPVLWAAQGPRQVYMTSLLTGVLGTGPGAIATAWVPDLHHFRGSYGAKDVIPLWRDEAGLHANVTAGVLDTLKRKFGTDVGPEALFAYAYLVLNGNYTQRFAAELEIPGPRIPISKDLNRFEKAAELGRRMIWLHTYGERLAPTGASGEIPVGAARCTVGISSDADAYPADFSYDAENERLTVGSGVFEPVAPAVYEFSVSGFGVVKSWLAFRMKNGAGRKSSVLDDIRPIQWPAAFTEDLCRLLWIVEATIGLIAEASELLAEIVAGPTFEADELPAPSEDERKAPEIATASEQLRLGD